VVADQLKKNRLRNAAYPFDWCETPLKSLYFIFKNDFINFLATPGVAFIHEDEGFEKSGNKYKRRIKRFYSVVESKEHILFLRFAQENENADKIDNFFREKFPNLKYSLVLIKESEIGAPKDDKYFNSLAYDLKWSRLFFEMKMINRLGYLRSILNAYTLLADRYIGKIGLVLKSKTPKLYRLIKRVI